MNIYKQIEMLEKKLKQSEDRVKQAEKQYKRSLAKIEEQKRKAEISKQNILQVKVHIANRICTLNQLKRALEGANK
jgi:hypothetical protein